MTYDELLMVLLNLVSVLMEKEKYITVRSYGARCVKDITDIEHLFAYLLFNCFYTVGPNCSYGWFCQLIGIPMGCDPAPFFKSKWMNQIRKNNLIKAKKPLKLTI